MAKAGRKRSAPHDTGRAEDAARRRISDRLAVFLDAETAVRRDDDPEGVHQMRVASRRLRAALDGSAGILPRKHLKTLRKPVKQLSDALGEVRDLDVQLGVLRELREDARSRELVAIDRLTGRLDHERVEARDRLMAALDDPKLRSRLESAAIRLDIDGSSRGRS